MTEKRKEISQSNMFTGSESVVRLLIDNGAYIDAVNDVGNSALIVATFYGKYNSIIVLMQRIDKKIPYHFAKRFR